MTDWELAIIGTAIADPAAMIEAEDLLPSDFTGNNQEVWGEILRLNMARALDPVSAGAAINEAVSNGVDYVRHALSFKGPNMKEYVARVIDAATHKSVMKVAAEIHAQAQDEKVAAKELIDYAERRIISLRRDRAEGQTLQDIMSVFVPRLNSLIDGTFKPAWVPKLLAVRNLINYAEDSDLIVIAARPGEGKSSFMRYEVLEDALQGNASLIINLDNDPIDYARWFIAAVTGIDARKLKMGKLSEVEHDMVQKAARDLAKLPIYFEIEKKADRIRTLARKYVIEKGVKTIVVDYIQQTANGIDNRVQDIAYTTGVLRDINLNLRIPVLAASQLSRDIEKRNNVVDRQGRSVISDPQLADLRESGAIENDATIVMFPRCTWTNPTDEQKRAFPENVNPFTRELYENLKAIPIRFHAKKNRNGEIGVSEVIKWVKSTGRYYTLQRPE